MSTSARTSEYVDKYSQAVFVERVAPFDHNPLWSHKADCAFPCATELDTNRKDAEQLMTNGVGLVAEGASMPSTPRRWRVPGARNPVRAGFVLTTPLIFPTRATMSEISEL